MTTKKRLTKRQALEECPLLWGYVAEHGCSKYTAIDRVLPHVKLYRAGCPCCEYHKISSRFHCLRQCLIKWPSTTGHCLSPGSPYEEFGELRSKHARMKRAAKIVELAQQALDKLKAKRNPKP